MDKMHKHLPPRWDSKDAWYFVTVVTLNRYPYFETEESCHFLLEACRSVRTIHPYRLGALVILPDHWHAVVKPLENEVIESIVGGIKQHAFHVSRKKFNPANPSDSHPDPPSAHASSSPSQPMTPTTLFRSHVLVAPPSTAAQIIRWQPRFMDHRIRDEADYFRHVEYMRLNPLKHGLASDENEPWQ